MAESGVTGQPSSKLWFVSVIHTLSPDVLKRPDSACPWIHSARELSAEVSSAPDGGVLGKGLWTITQMTSHERAHTPFSDYIKLPLLTLGHVLPLVSPELCGVLTNKDPSR